MKIDTLLQALFPHGHDVQVNGPLVHGRAQSGGVGVAVIGTADCAPIGVETALALAGGVIETMRTTPNTKPRMPILLLVSNNGQRLSRRDELLGNNACLAHLAECLDVARHRGHPVISLVYEEAVSGGFLAAGMIADRTYALPDAQIRVMNLPAMSRITQIPLDRLEALCESSSVFAPGVPSFYRLGIVDDVWDHDLSAALAKALGEIADDEARTDHRAELGLARGGRTLAAPIARRIREARP